MLTAKKALAAARVYTQETAQEMGALKGAPCTIKSIVKSGNLNTVTFEWTDRSEVTHESTMLVYDGTNGTDGQDGAPGADGFSPTITVKTATSSEYVLTITDKNGSYDTPNLKGGGGGGGGASSLSDLDDIALSSLANGDVLVYDSTAGKWKNVQLDIPTQLSDLSDIDLASLADADILKYDFDNQKWVNGKLDYSELTGTPTLGTAAAKDSTDAVTQGSTELLESGGAYTALDGKVDKVTGKGLSTNDFTDAEKQKLDNMELDDLADVDMSGITDGQILAWDNANSKMVPADNTGEEYTAGMGIDISAGNEISTEFIMYPGTKAEWDLLPTSEKIKYTHTAWEDSQSGIVDNLPTQNSDNLVKSGGVWTGLDAKADKATTLNGYGITDAYTKTETDNAITAEIEKLDVTDSAVTGSYVTAVSETDGKISVTREAADASPTQSSNKMVKSGGVYSALGDKADKVTSATTGDFAGLDASGNLTDSGKKASDFATAQGLADEAATRSYMGAKNLIRFPYETTSYSILTVEDDGGLTLNGTPTTDFWIAINNNTSDVHPYVLPAGRYIFSCKRVGNVAITLGVRTVDGDVSLASMYFGNEDYIESTFELAEATDLKVRGYIGANIACDGTIYPMIRLATDADTTYQLYAKTNKELTDEVSANASGLADEAKTRGAMGAKNLIPMDQVKDSTVNSHGTWSGNVYTDNGVEFTFNPENGTVVANGTSNGGEGTHATFYYAVRSNDSRLNMPANTYKLTGCPAGGSSSTYFLYLNTKYQSNNTNNGGMTDEGEGVTATYANDMWAGVYVDIANGTTVTNLEFKPMLRLASDIDDTYQPYAKTNKELTDEVGGKLDNVVISDISQIPNSDIKDLPDGLYTIILGVITDPNILNAPPCNSGVQLLITTASSGFRYFNCTPYNKGWPTYFGGCAPAASEIEWRPVVITPNSNLLDNPWFTVNQRGFTDTLPSNGYCVDRFVARGTMGVSLSNGVITLVNNRSDGSSWFGQKIEQQTAYGFVGKPMTLSFMLSDGDVKSWSFVLTDTSSAKQSDDFNINGSVVYLRTEWTNSVLNVLLWLRNTNDTISIKAMKLELGHVSTLALDVEPNYQDELDKCQRYFERIGGTNLEVFATGIYEMGTILTVALKYKRKRVAPSATLNGTVYCWDDSHMGASALPATTISSPFLGFDGYGRISFDVTGGTGGKFGLAQFRDTTSYLDLSADL